MNQKLKLLFIVKIPKNVGGGVWSLGGGGGGGEGGM